MEQRQFSAVNLNVSLLGYGGMRFPTIDGQDAQIDECAATALIDRALAGGINYFDTAYMYHGGKSEDFMGRALARHPRESYYLADKLPCWKTKTPEEVDVLFEEQLTRCGTAYFDFYLAHALSVEHYPIFESSGAFEVLARKKAEGKIRNLGFSFHDAPALLARILADHPWDFAQIQLNYLDWTLQSAKEQYELIVARGLPVVVMEPVRGGALATLSDKAAGILKAAQPNRSVASWAIRFVASLPGVMCVLSGMSSEEQLEDNLSTMTPFSPLGDEERAILQQALTAYLGAGTIPCTGCRYCMDCPAGVDIPKCFAMYNQFKLDGREGHLRNSHYYMGEEHQPHQCVGCGACLSLCPQHIDIPARLVEVTEAVAAIKGE